MPPTKAVRDNEAAVLDLKNGRENIDLMQHTLRLPNDRLIVHSFYAYTPSYWKELGLDITPYGENSVLLTKSVDPRKLIT